MLESDKSTDSTQNAIKEEVEGDIDSSEENIEEQEPEEIINLEGLETIESQDVSKVKIIKKEIQKNAVSGFTMRGGDALYLTISNSTDMDVTMLKIYVVGYTNKNGLTEVQPSYSATYGTVPYVQVFETTDTIVSAGQSEEIGIEVEADNFVGVKAIVASYTTADGTVYENDMAQEWIDSVQLGQNIVLD